MVLLPLLAGGAELASFQAGNGGWHLGTLAVGNLDSDPTPEIVVPYRDQTGQWFLDAFKPNGTRLPGFPYASGGSEMNVSPTLYDLDGDGRMEILFTRGNSVIVLRGNGSVLWSNAITRANYIPTGGYMTVTNGFYWSKDGSWLTRLPDTTIFSSQVSSPIVADLDGNGTKEVVTAWKIDPDNTSGDQDFNPFINDLWGSAEWGTAGETWSGGVVFFNALNGTRNHVYHLHQLVESGVALGQADTDRPLEVYVLNDSDSVVCFDKTQPHGLFGNGTLHKQFGKNQRLMSGSYELGVDVYTADLDGDGRAEVLVPTPHLDPLWQPNETILDDDGAILWRRWKQAITFPLDQWQNNACMIPINPDHDNRVDVLTFAQSYEIAFRTWNGVELVDRPGWPITFYPYLPTPPVVGDVDGDGQEDIVIGTYHPERKPSDGFLYVYSLNGTRKISVPVPGGLKHIPTLADLNGDGGIEVIYRSLAGRIYIQNFGATKPGPVSWATHRGNAQRDGNFALSLFPAGTPLVPEKRAGYRRATFSWTTSEPNRVKRWRIYRAEQPDGPFGHVVTLNSNATSYTDEPLESGVQYFYEVEAVRETNALRSAPFVVTPLLNNNLIVNGGFEENDNSHWDKWFTGAISWSNMVTTPRTPYHGRKSMEITLVNNGNNGSISQYGQYGTPDAYLPVVPGTLYSFGGFFKSRGLSQPSEHWFEWGSTRTGEDTNARPVRPWPYYFTPHFVIGTNVTEWTYANRTFVLPSGFPNVELGHRFTIAAPGSGSICIDDVFFRALPAPVSTNWLELIPFRGAWRYASGAQPTNWFAPEFRETGWATGSAKFGAGGGPTNVVTQLVARQPAYYFRRTFVFPQKACEELLLAATCTEADTNSLELYLNGTRLVTSGIEPVSAQGNRVEYYDLTPFIDLLRPGTNLIAALLRNVWQPTWDDVAFDLNLKAITYEPMRPGFRSIQRGGALQTSDIILNIGVPANSVWRLESTDSLLPPTWQPMELLTTSNASIISVRDVGQGGRTPPNNTATRAYRLLAD